MQSATKHYLVRRMVNRDNMSGFSLSTRYPHESVNCHTFILLHKLLHILSSSRKVDVVEIVTFNKLVVLLTAILIMLVYFCRMKGCHHCKHEAPLVLCLDVEDTLCR